MITCKQFLLSVVSRYPDLQLEQVKYKVFKFERFSILQVGIDGKHLNPSEVGVSPSWQIWHFKFETLEFKDAYRRQSLIFSKQTALSVDEMYDDEHELHVKFLKKYFEDT